MINRIRSLCADFCSVIDSHSRDLNEKIRNLKDIVGENPIGSRFGSIGGVAASIELQLDEIWSVIPQKCFIDCPVLVDLYTEIKWALWCHYEAAFSRRDVDDLKEITKEVAQ